MKNKQTQGFYEFASFRLDAKKRRLTCCGEIVSLTPKEFDVLFFLIENAGRVVERDELLDAVWTDIFVEEGTLTRNISWLRKKLAAHVGDQKIIETLPKRGYRFLPEITCRGEAPLIIEEQIVQEIQIEEIIEFESSPHDGDDSIIPSSNDIEAATSPPKNLESKSAFSSFDNSEALLPAPVRRSFSMIWLFPATLVLIIAAFAAYHGYVSSRQPSILLATKIAPFSGLPGRENSPAFSPDGKQMVFSWDGGADNDNFDVYVKLIGAGEPVRLTSGEPDEINPVFSPDGKSIAFVRVFPTHNEITMIPALGGAERVIYDRASYASISFSPDGNSLAAAELDLLTNETGIYTINLLTGEKTRLTMPEAPVVDHTPRFSPDGKLLAFIRYFSSFKREIFVVPATGGEPRQITADDVRIYGLAWYANSESLFFTSFREVNQLNLWRVSINGDAPQMIATGSKNLNDLAISPDGKTIAFVEEATDENIWEIAPEQSLRPLIRSTRADHSQQFSPDGTKIVFASERTGNYEIWLSNADGKNQRQLTDSQGSAGSPRFSPDGKHIAYDTQIAGGSDIYVVSVNGGIPRRLTENAKNNSLPAWSVDGSWIFFLSNRSGSEQIWKMPVIGGEAVQITRQGAFEMFAAPDGKKIIYSKGTGKSGLWSVGTDGGDEKPIPELNEAGAWRSWSVAPNGVYFTAFAPQIPLYVKFYDFKTGQIHQIAAIDKLPLAYYANLTASSDGKRILYARQDQTNTGIMLAELAE
ncbi:MAG TPA: winged helix-turn-helix domain-containing protein [Pyrinomonadaceae bacterium]|nr:winged helix-turn-helix domain-containing protein [Pyrinomonadaceae bacterium]